MILPRVSFGLNFKAEQMHRSNFKSTLCKCFLQNRNFRRTFSQVKNIEKVLIANRGEIACRVLKTAQKLGVKTVAVYSDVDRNALHVSMADEAYHIGPASSDKSYLMKNKIVDVALLSGCQAIHPGYGFLSENAEFAELCAEKGLIFIGPPAEAIQKMGIKSTSKAIMSAAGVPVIEGYHGSDQCVSRLKEEAIRIGFPLMIKAVRGGGGKGMRISRSFSDFTSQLESAQRESLKSFGDSSVLLEKFIEAPRHVEVQIFGDTHGNFVYLFERDCSIQRRHQKVIEEAPAPGVDERLRRNLGETAVRAAKAVNYVGAGTVEFIVDKHSLSFHFMEMNTRLQVEHPITEMITGTDLVEWQFKVASGDPIPLLQEEITLKGHAFEARIYAENPFKGFLPGAGHLTHLVTPPSSVDVRVETGVKQGDEISVHYDPMIAKLVVWGNNRREAILKLRQRLAQYQIAGLDTNLNFLIQLCYHDQFILGDVHTNFIEEHQNELLIHKEYKSNFVIQAVLATIFNERIGTLQSARNDKDSCNPFSSEMNFRLSYQYVKQFSFTHNNHEIPVEVTYVDENSFLIKVGNDGALHKVTGYFSSLDNLIEIRCNIEEKFYKSHAVIIDNDIHIFTQDGSFVFNRVLPKFLSEISNATNEIITSDAAVAPMPGVVEKIFVKLGDQVKMGDPLLVVIAMKMEHVIRSPRDGIIENILCVAGDSVTKNSYLVQFNQEK